MLLIGFNVQGGSFMLGYKQSVSRIPHGNPCCSVQHWIYELYTSYMYHLKVFVFALFYAYAFLFASAFLASGGQ